MGSIVIIGANLAGGRAAEALRQNGFEGRVILIGEEPWSPYERPPLSKEGLRPSSSPASDYALYEESWYEENLIELYLGVRAEAIDLRGGGVSLSTGVTLPADQILLTTGSRVRKLTLPGADCANVHYLRTKDESRRLAQTLQPGAKILVLGMGVIGAEVAASARMMGCDVAIVEAASAPMARTVGMDFGNWLARYHHAKGVHTHFSNGVVRLIFERARVYAVELEDGTYLPCDAIVVGIGVIPATELAIAAGIAVNDGIIVDRQCRTNHAHIFAAGDVTKQASFFGGDIRQETYQNAVDQSAAAAEAMMGVDVDYLKPCMFWSDQYDLNIQVSGQIHDKQRAISRGDRSDDNFSTFFLSDDDVIEAVLSVNRPVDMGVGKRLVEKRVKASVGALKDESVPLRSILSGQI